MKARARYTPISGRMFPMRSSIKKTVVAGIAALGMATAVASTPTPAEAQWHGGGGFHGGGFHGGFGGGGFRGGGWRGGGWGGGWRGGWGWGGGCWNCGWGWGLATGALLGAAATYPYYGYGYGYPYPYYGAGYGYGGGPGCWVRRRVWTARGRYLGRRLVNICY
jgi:hypothetical protein